jgi:putative transposase
MADVLSEAAYRRWISQWRRRHIDVWVFMREGKKQWNDNVALYLERDPTLIAVGDLVVADGHVLDFEILSPATGKPKRMHLILWYDFRSNMPLGWEIDETENTACIASALRRAILRLGRIPTIAYMDNGKAFRSRFFAGCPDLSTAGFAGIFQAMGIQTIFAWAYHGQSKTIERFFKTFGELERLLPSYCGASVDTKPARMRRNEDLHRRLHATVLPQGAIGLEDAHRAIAAWFETYANRPQRGHLNGASPGEVFDAGKGPGVDPEALHELMMAAQGRVIRNGTVSINGRRYYAPCLYGRHHGCTVRYDIQDPSTIVVYEETGERIGKANELPKLHPAATILGDDQDRELLSAMIAEKRRQLKHTSAPLRQLVEDQVIPETRARMALLGIGGADSKKDETGRMTDEGAKGLLEITDEQAAAILEQVEAGQVENDASAFFGRLASMPEAERYEALIEAEGRGWLIPERWQKFMAYFEDTDGYRRQADYFAQRRAVLMETGRWAAQGIGI